MSIAKCYLVEPFSCKENDPITEVTKKLRQYDQRHIFVVDENGKPVGLVSTSDILDKIVVEGKTSADVTAKDIMTTDILSYEDESDIKEAYKDMNQKGYVSCAVCQDGKMVGILTMKEAIRYLTDPENIC